MKIEKVVTGMHVRYTGRTGCGVQSKMYPETGTVGTVKQVNRQGTALVQWPEGSTSHNDLWWAAAADLEPVQEGSDDK